MSNAETQACLARLYIDDAFRKLFYLAPETTLSVYKLTEAEFKVIQSIDHERLDFFSSMLKEKQKRKVHRAYPLLLKVAGEEMELYSHRYGQLHPPQPHEASLPWLLKLGTFLEQCLRDDEDVPIYTGDLARYETYYLATAMQPPVREVAALLEHEQHPAVIKLEDYPYLVGGNKIVTFTYNIPRIVDSIKQGVKPPESSVQLGQYSYIFRRSSSSPLPEVLSITAAIHQLLSFCDGQHCLNEIIHIMEHSLGNQSLEEHILRVIRHLVDLNVVGVRYG